MGSGWSVSGARTGSGGPSRGLVAEADGNRTRLAEILGHVSFEDREGHQAPLRLHAEHQVSGRRPGLQARRRL